MHHNKIKMVANILTLIIWAFFIFCGISAGLNATDLEEAWKLDDHRILIFQKLVSTILPLFCGALFSVRIVKAKGVKTIPGKIADKLIGQGFSEIFDQKVRFQILGALFFLLIGGIGLLRAVIFGATEKAIYEMLFPFSFGIGIAIPLIVQKLKQHRKLDA